MLALERFVEWMSANEHMDRLGNVYRYHPRSDAHSKALCTFVLNDLLAASPPMRKQAAQRGIVFGINQTFTWAASGKKKTLDLVISPPSDRPPTEGPGPILPGRLDAYTTVVIDCDNRGPARLWSDPPAPQPAERDHYKTFLARVVRFYEERFSAITQL